MAAPEAHVEVAPALRPVTRTRLVERLAALPVPVWLVGLVTVSAAFRFLFALWMPAPWIFADELEYSELAKSFAATGHFAIRDVPGLGLGPVYPVVISPAYAAFRSVPDAYLLIKAINSVVMSLAAVPAYLLARRLLSRSWSLAAAALSVAVPSMVYTGLVMTESVFYSLFLTVVLAMVAALERPSARRQLGALGLIVLAVATRFQAVALVPAFVTAIVAVSLGDAAGERPRLRAPLRRLQEFRATWITLFVGVVALAGWEVSRGRSVFAFSGNGRGLWHQHYSLVSVAKWFLYHLSELDLYVGVLPFAAFLVVATYAFSRSDRALRIFSVVSLSLVFWLVLTVAVFTSGLTRLDPHSSSHVVDRYTFYVVPLLLIALAAWGAQRARASARLTAVAGGLAAVLVIALPYKTLIRDDAVPDAIAFLPWSSNHNGAVVAMAHVTETVGLIALALAGLFYLLRTPRLSRFAPVLVVVSFFVTFSSVERWYHTESSAAAAGGDSAWIDRAIGPNAEAVALWSGKVGPHFIWENEFFNRSVGRIYYLHRPSWQGLPEQHVRVGGHGRLYADGSTAPVRARYVLLDPSVTPLRGRLVAVDERSAMRLFAVDPRGRDTAVEVARR